MVHDPARRTDHDMNAAVELADLAAVVLAAVHRQHMKAFHFGGVALKGFGHLNRQLTRWREHHQLHMGFFQIQPGEQGHGESGRLAGTCRRIAEHVLAFEQQGNRAGLDGRGGFVTYRFKSLQNRGGQVQVAKTRNLGELFGHQNFLVRPKSTGNHRVAVS